MQGLIIMKLTTKGLKTKFIITIILLLKESLLPGFDVLISS
jgi:hypothetical protein